MIESMLIGGIVFALGGVAGCWYGRREAARGRRRIMVDALSDAEFQRLESVAADDLFWGAPLHIAETREQLALERIAVGCRSDAELRNEEGYIQGLEAFKEGWLELLEMVHKPVKKVDVVEAG